MKGFCKDDERLIDWNESSGVIDYSQLIGAKVKIRRISGRTNWKGISNRIYTIINIKFRISVDGKCFAVVYLDDCPNDSFILADLYILKIKENNG